ncbi:3-oxoacyl-[acyl-carrier protein] reductase [Pseudoalteromonas luteoviolacea B = ATCC 29581]|nr:3-oxoacyl-[acyl-carrier protein] reductase [Pseudoalteromonas luteoviolacea B = ATCC 29581]
MATLYKKVVWITGASGGIGEALAKECALAGAFVVLSARREKELQRVRSQLQCPEKHLCLPLDITDTEAGVQALKHIIEKYGHLDWLINNAGLSQRALIRDTTIETDRKLFEVDFFAQIQLTRTALESLIAQQGKVVFISSVAGLVGTQYRGTYSAAKAALHLWANSLRAELANEGLSVATVFPGFVKTDVSINALTGDGKALGQMDNAQANAMSAEDFAQQTLSALLRDKQYVVVGGFKEKLAAMVSRISPEILYRMIRKSKVR